MLQESRQFSEALNRGQGGRVPIKYRYYDTATNIYKRNLRYVIDFAMFDLLKRMQSSLVKLPMSGNGAANGNAVAILQSSMYLSGH